MKITKKYSKKGLGKDIKVFLKKKKKMIKKKKEKNLLEYREKYRKKTSYYNYKKLFSFRKTNFSG